MMKLERTPAQWLSAFCVLILLTGSPAALAGGDAADAAMAAIRPEAIRADMRFLADDLLEGRGTATRGHEIAAAFMATRFEAMGLQPAGDNGTYFQNVPLRSSRIDQTRSTLTFVRAGEEEVLTFRQDYLARGDAARADISVQAPIVFVGFGVTAPEQSYDDYQGIDAKGKIVAYIYGAPNFESALKAHYSSTTLKARNAVAHGAVGTIGLDDPIYERRYPYEKRVRGLAIPSYHWLDKQGQPDDYFPELLGQASLSLPASQKLFEGSLHTADEVFAAAKAGKLFSFPLPVTAKIHTVTQLGDARSPNVVAKLEGSDPLLKDEYLVYTAHLDHLGISEAVRGDTIYNGALDNASGSATMLEIARAFSAMNPRPRRSILFVSVTAEEAGLLGSDYFAHYPTVAKNSIVADINVDEIFMLWPLQDIVAWGAEHSSLQSVIKKAAQRMNLVYSPDPVPEEVVFIRSDQYSFVKQGIPSVMPSPGFASSDPSIKPRDIFADWEEIRYHQPQDDMQQPGLDFQAAAQFARFAFLCGYLVTEDTARPAWNQGDFFAAHFPRQTN